MDAERKPHKGVTGCSGCLIIVGVVLAFVIGIVAVAAITAKPTSNQVTPAAGKAGSPVVPPAHAAYDIAAISASCQPDPNIGFSTCTGSVKNLSGYPLQNVEAVVEWADANGVVQTSDEALIDFDPLLPDQESTWKVISRYNPALTASGVLFKTIDGQRLNVRYDFH